MVVYDDTKQNDPDRKLIGLERILRGGAWHNGTVAHRVSERTGIQHATGHNDVWGFRVVALINLIEDEN